jgi:hypothetical protein
MIKLVGEDSKHFEWTMCMMESTWNITCIWITTNLQICVPYQELVICLLQSKASQETEDTCLWDVLDEVITKVLCDFCISNMNHILHLEMHPVSYTVKTKSAWNHFRAWSVERWIAHISNIEVHIGIRKNTAIIIDHMCLMLVHEQCNPAQEH